LCPDFSDRLNQDMLPLLFQDNELQNHRCPGTDPAMTRMQRPVSERRL
jgi:hypothetical protein